MLFTLRDIPKYEAIRTRAARYPEIDAAGVESFLLLMQVGSDVFSAFERFLSRFNLSHGSFSVLMILNRDPSVGLNPSDLATKCGVTRATMTGLLDGLERKQLLRRESEQADRRTVLIRLTEQGTIHLEGMVHEYYRRIAKLMAALPDPEKHAFSSMLRKIGLEVESAFRLPVPPTAASAPSHDGHAVDHRPAAHNTAPGSSPVGTDSI